MTEEDGIPPLTFEAIESVIESNRKAMEDLAFIRRLFDSGYTPKQIAEIFKRRA